MVFMVVCSWCVRWWWLFSLLSVALVCLLAVGVYLACGACGVHELACVCGLSACSSGVRVRVCVLCSCSAFRACVRVLAC